MKIILLFISFFFCFSILQIQASSDPIQDKIDSVKTVLSNTNELSKKAALYNQLSKFEAERAVYTAAAEYARQANTNAINAKNDQETAISLLNLGIAELGRENYDTAIYYLNEGLILPIKQKIGQLQQLFTTILVM